MSALTERPLLYAARPTISVAGRARPELGAAVSALAVSEATDGLFALEATFGNWGTKGGGVGYLYFDRALFDFGTEIDVEIGAGQAAGRIFRGRISAIEGRFPTQRPPEIRILAEDRLQDLRMTRRTRTFEDVSTSDVVDRIAGDHGLQAQADVESVSYPVVAQLNQSDLAFLRDLARAVDAEVWVDDRTLHIQARGRRRGAEVTLVYGQTLREFAVTADLAHQRSSVNLSGWDVDGKSAIDERATDATVSGELDGGRSGAALLKDKLGERTEHVVHQVPLSTREARARAEARFRWLARRFVRGYGVAEGDARIRVGARMKLGELGPLFNGAYTACEVKHTFDQSHGYRTCFTAERPGMGEG